MSFYCLFKAINIHSIPPLPWRMHQNVNCVFKSFSGQQAKEAREQNDMIGFKTALLFRCEGTTGWFLVFFFRVTKVQKGRLVNQENKAIR